jgi:hypothetical protein
MVIAAEIEIRDFILFRTSIRLNSGEKPQQSDDSAATLNLRCCDLINLADRRNTADRPRASGAATGRGRRRDAGLEPPAGQARPHGASPEGAAIRHTEAAVAAE